MTWLTCTVPMEWRGWGLGAFVLRVLVAAFFVMMALKNLSGDATMVADFRRWGYSDGFRQLTAWMQIMGAVLLLLPSASFVGGVFLGGVLLGAIVTHAVHDPPMAALSPLVFLVLVSVSVVSRRPDILR